MLSLILVEIPYFFFTINPFVNCRTSRNPWYVSCETYSRFIIP